MDKLRVWLKARLPSLAMDHPGYFRVALGLTLLHIGLGVDFLLPGRHGSPAFVIVGHIIPFGFLAFLHFFTAIIIIYGLYRQFEVARWGFRISITTFWAVTVAFGYAAVISPLVSFGWMMVYGFISICSLAAAQEPEHGPLEATKQKEILAAAEEVRLLLSNVKRIDE